jgi:hypothetical protein
MAGGRADGLLRGALLALGVAGFVVQVLAFAWDGRHTTTATVGLVMTLVGALTFCSVLLEIGTVEEEE